MRQLVAKALTSFVRRRSCWAFMCQLVNEFAGEVSDSTKGWVVLPPTTSADRNSFSFWWLTGLPLTYLQIFGIETTSRSAITGSCRFSRFSALRPHGMSFHLLDLPIRLAEGLFICQCCLPFWFAVWHILAALQHFDVRWPWKIAMEKWH